MTQGRSAEIISMIQNIHDSRLSIKNSLSLCRARVSPGQGCGVWCFGFKIFLGGWWKLRGSCRFRDEGFSSESRRARVSGLGVSGSRIFGLRAWDFRGWKLRERIFIELMTSDRKLKASREGSK